MKVEIVLLLEEIDEQEYERYNYGVDVHTCVYRPQEDDLVLSHIESSELRLPHYEFEQEVEHNYPVNVVKVESHANSVRVHDVENE